MERAVADGAQAVSEMIDLTTDLTWRYLIDREGLSASAALVLNRLYREGPMRLTALASAEGASQSGMTQLVQRMERQCLVERWSDPQDGRASLVMLGEEGRRLWEGRSDIRRQRIETLLPTLAHDDLVALWLASQVVVRVLGQLRDTACSPASEAAQPGE
ncbi:MarR family transcriptional regulator [Mycolicibacterium sp. CH28]|uniref:MarR family winged helix-turn-helix transcriptional regulator n=1 Tax=Mycolicibacterium sp. CH28 TaxID=2512237 RepID=UPI001080591F|nr:MarR family transcriptional regulator [Mycolicibacterium sp. CH28]TGD84958.1 MarR family transcriptional regulator [Mycolicibacterium sp. CH28]